MIKYFHFLFLSFDLSFLTFSNEIALEVSNKKVWQNNCSLRLKVEAYVFFLLLTEGKIPLKFLSSGSELLGVVMSVGLSICRSVCPWKILTIFDNKVSWVILTFKVIHFMKNESKLSGRGNSWTEKRRRRRKRRKRRRKRRKRSRKRKKRIMKRGKRRKMRKKRRKRRRKGRRRRVRRRK